MTAQSTVRDQPLESLRYERKFLVKGMDEHQIKTLVRLHPAMFMMPYPPRWVNNIYLDSEELDNYQDNVNGAVDRRKVRLRWYHGLFDTAASTTLEIKIKRGLVGRKVQYKMGPFQLTYGFCQDSLQAYFKKANLPSAVALMLLSQQPVLINVYKRWYFATHDGRFRITVDAEMAFYHVHQMANTFRYMYKADDLRVMEIKYQKSEDPAAGKISSFFPFSVYKNSKYVLGMESVYW